MESCPAGSEYDPMSRTCVNCATSWEYVRRNFAVGQNPWPGPDTPYKDIHSELLPPRECPHPSWVPADLWGWDGHSSLPAAAEAAAKGVNGSGNISDLESKFAQQKTVYDNLVSNALDANDASPGTISAIADARAAMNNTLSEMLRLTEQTGRGASQDELIERIMEIQRDYNGLLVATDKLETLRRIRQQQDLVANGSLRIYGLGFLIACVGLIIVIARKS